MDDTPTVYDVALQDAVQSVGVWKDTDKKFRIRFMAMIDVVVFSKLAAAAKGTNVHMPVGEDENGSPNQNGYM